MKHVKESYVRIGCTLVPMFQSSNSAALSLPMLATAGSFSNTGTVTADAVFCFRQT